MGGAGKEKLEVERPVGRGTISTEFTAHGKREASKWARGRGWRYTQAHGWRCPTCAK